MIDDTAPRARYSDADLEEFRAIIEQKLERAQSDLDFYRETLRGSADNADAKVKGLDDGTSTAEMERVTALAARQQKLIRHLENALTRIENKIYGVCRETGALIPKDRLRAVPHATLSIEAKQARR